MDAIKATKEVAWATKKVIYIAKLDNLYALRVSTKVEHLVKAYTEGLPPPKSREEKYDEYKVEGSLHSVYLDIDWANTLLQLGYYPSTRLIEEAWRKASCEA